MLRTVSKGVTLPFARRTLVLLICMPLTKFPRIWFAVRVPHLSPCYAFFPSPPPGLSIFVFGAVLQCPAWAGIDIFWLLHCSVSASVFGLTQFGSFYGFLTSSGCFSLPSPLLILLPLWTVVDSTVVPLDMNFLEQTRSWHEQTICSSVNISDT